VKRSLVSLLALVAVTFLCGAGSYVPGVPPLEVPLGDRLPLFSIVPFVGLLVAIALLPALAADWWESNVNKAKVATLCGLTVAGLMLFHFGWTGLEALVETAIEYVSLMTLLAALFVVCGGILIEGSFRGTPLVNTAILALGALLANVVGTTGASLILIRPLLRANAHRRKVAHVPIFFIFIVANCGGLLTPLGDPPLFLGYLAGVPFGWTLQLVPIWALVNGSLLAMFLVWDSATGSREQRDAPTDAAKERSEAVTHEPFRLRGLDNVGFLLAIVAIVFAAGRGVGNGGERWPFGVQEALLAILAAVSMNVTKPDVREKNHFTFGPIVEIAVLFAGIFITMTPALAILNARATRLGLTEPWQYFWASGLFSSVLDNAPTYMAITSVACGTHGLPVEGHYLAHALGLSGVAFDPVLAAISCGCVFMGALTYIGNGPNFMVRAIAQESNVRMPGFLGFTICAMTVLFPVFALVTILFFRS
jgi:Na+/H+ antiporter NhaD/arsenite permease-like protein